MNRIVSTWMIIGILWCLFSSCSNQYYVSPEGDDSRSGKSPSKAWKSIDRVNTHDFEPGEEILFKGKEIFQGTVIFTSEDAGTRNQRIMLSSYGEGRAMIRGSEEEGLRADSCHYLTIENLEFEGSGRKTGNVSDGVLIRDCDAVILNDLDTHGFQKSGVHLHQCDDATITGVYAHENGFAGIHVTGTTMRDPEKYDNHNLYIGYCVAENNPGDPTVLDNHSGNGILAFSVKMGTIEYCEAFNNGWDMPWTGNGPVGIWKNERRGTMRNCKIYNNTFDNSKTGGSNIWLYDNYPGYHFRNNVFVYRGSLVSGGKTLIDEIFGEDPGSNDKFDIGAIELKEQ